MGSQNYQQSRYDEGLALTPATTTSSDISPVNAAMSGQAFFSDYSLDPATFQQQCGLMSSYDPYTESAPIGMGQEWGATQQQYMGMPQQSLPQQAIPMLVPQVSMSRSIKSDDGDDISEPTSPVDEASARRKEVSQLSCHKRFISS